MTMPAIEFRDVRFTYDEEENALEEINLVIESGEYVCIVGGNGSGKSTLARHINGLLLPDEGEVRVFGTSTHDSVRVMEIRANVGMVFQNPDDQLVASIVENEIAFGPENRGLPSTEIRARVSRALEVVGLDGFEKRRVDELSGGQKQRVAIAGALALNPKILVLDEATAMLDPMGKAGFLRVIDRLNASGMTVVMITHEVSAAQKANRCIALDNGRIAGDSARGDSARALVGIGYASSGESGSPEACARPCSGGGSDVGGSGAGNSSGSSGSGCGDNISRSVISVENVSYSYERVPHRRKSYRHREHPRSSTPRWGEDPRASWALSELSFDVREGEVFGIAGHTGSGKSTLLQLMCGFRRATSGAILLDGEDLSDKRVARSACKRIGLAFQYPEYQLFAHTVEEDIAFGPRNLGLSDEEVSRRVCEALDLVGLPKSLAKRSPFELSDGQQRRVALAGVVAMKPEVLVLDEPAAGLDAQGRQSLYSLVHRLHSAGKTVVLVSHSMDDLASLCSRVLVLNQGKRYSLGAPHEVLSDSAVLQAIGLDVPCDSEIQGAFMASADSAVFDTHEVSALSAVANAYAEPADVGAIVMSAQMGGKR